MSTRIEWMGATYTGVNVHAARDVVGQDTVDDGNVAVSFSCDEAFVIEGRKDQVVKLLEDAARLVRELPDEL